MTDTRHLFWHGKVGIGIAADTREQAERELAAWLKTKEAKGLPRDGWNYFEASKLVTPRPVGLCFDGRKGVLNYKV